MPDQLHNRLMNNSAAMLKSITGLNNLPETLFSKNPTFHILMDGQKQVNNVKGEFKKLNAGRGIY